jgi:hypothetical protein
VAYTKIIPEANIELSGIWDMEFYTNNPTTRYQNGILSDLEVLAIKRFKDGFGIGFVESRIQQVTDDEGTQRACFQRSRRSRKLARRVCRAIDAKRRRFPVTL